ncbi:MAG: ABC transporter permease [Alicyclobacillus sp.]|nr:ABC transporter permease [Alicyclobacillus sp.]
MSVRDTLRVALRSIAANKMRSILTMLGIIIGVASVIALSALGQAETLGITQQIESLGTNLLTVSPGSAGVGGIGRGFGSQQTLTYADAQEIQQDDPDVAYVSPMIQATAQVVFGANNNSVSVQGTSDSYAALRNLTLAEGTYFTAEEVARSENVAVLGSDIAQTLFEGTGTSPIGATIDIAGMPFTVVGVLAPQDSSGFQNPNDNVEIPITTAMNEFTGTDYVSQILASATSASTMNQAEEEMTSTLRFMHHLGTGQTSDFQISNQATTLSVLSSSTKLLTNVLAGVAAISLLVGGIGIMNIMLVSVTERTREIGVRKAIGAKRSSILLQFLIESVTLSLAGAFIGLILGIGGADLTGALMHYGNLVTATPVLSAVAFSFIVGIVFGVYPARKAANLNTIDALRYE